MIACILVPYFAATVERQIEPSLDGLPLVIGGFPWEAGKVFAVSEEAGRLGVYPGMPLRQAQAVCPQARFLPGAPARYQAVFERLAAVLVELAPSVEPGEAHPAAVLYLDLENLADAEPVEIVQAVVQTVRDETGLAFAIGLAASKFPARLAAALAEPNEALLVASSYESTFLAPLPVGLLPLDKETARRLQLLGIRTLGQFAELPVGSLMAQLGLQGQLLHRLATGHDEGHAALVPIQTQAVESVAHVFADPVTDGTMLEAVLQRMAGTLAKRLRRQGLAGREVCLGLHLDNPMNGEVERESRLVLRHPTAHPDRLARILLELLGQSTPECGVTKMEATLAELTPAIGQQLDLFAYGVEQDGRLNQALQDLAARYGAECFYRVSLTDQLAPLPERRFRLHPVKGP